MSISLAMVMRVQAIALKLAAGGTDICTTDAPVIVMESSVYNAWTDHRRIVVHDTLMLRSSDAELAFVIGHEMGHICNRREGIVNSEENADLVGAALALRAGYDWRAPYIVLAKIGGSQRFHALYAIASGEK